jgi:hypothetical protein
MDVTGYLTSLIKYFGGPVVVAGALWIFGKWIGERWLERRFESHKAELVRLTEQLKHGLEKEMLKAQLSTSKVHEVYPKLYEKLSRAHGAVAQLVGLSWEPTYEDYNDEDFSQLLIRARLPHGQREQLLTAIGKDRGRGIDELKRVMRRIRVQSARREVINAKNFRVLKALYLSKEVKSLATEIDSTLWSTWVDIETGYESPPSGTPISVIPKLSELDEKLQRLDEVMRQELQPRN